MANKKISELTTRTPSLSDLMLVGDPSSGYSFKCTVTALATIIETDIADGYVTLGTAQTISGAKTFSNNLTLTSVSNAGVDTDKFLVLSGSNVVNFRTGAEVLSDIGAQAALTNPITGTGTSGQVSYFNGTNSITSSPTFAFTPTSQLLVNNSVTAASAIARGINATPTLTAAANNDVLVGLDINPTFTNGAFTGVTNTTARFTNNVNAGGGAQLSLNSTAVTDARAYLSMQINATEIARIEAINSSKAISFNATDANGFIRLVTQGTDRLTIAASSITASTIINSNVNASGGTAQLVLNSTAGSDPRAGISFTNGGVASGDIFAIDTDKSFRINAVNASGLLRFATAGTDRMRVFNNGNVLIQNGGAFTDAGFRLDVNGTARVQGNTTILGGSLTVNASSAAISIQNAASGNKSWSLITSGNNLQVREDGIGFPLQFNAGGNVLANQTSGTFTIGSATPSAAKLEVTGSITAASAIARGVNFTNTLVAAANNDVLVGLDINPTFTNGAFTNLNNIGLRVFGSTITNNTTPSIEIRQPNATSTTYLSVRNQGSYSTGTIAADFGITGSAGGFFSSTVAGDIVLKGFSQAATSKFFIGTTSSNQLVLFPTNNVAIGTATDAGFRLDISGTARVQTSLQVGNFTVGVNNTAKINTDGVIRASGGFNVRDATGNDNIFTGIKGSGNTVIVTSGNNDILQLLNVGSAASGSYLNFINSANPSTGTGTVNFINLNTSIVPTGNNSIAYNYIHVSGNITQGAFTGGTITGFLYNPSLTSLTSVHRAIQTVTGDVIFGSTSGNVMIGTFTAGGRFTIQPTNDQVGMAISGSSLTGSNAQSLVSLSQTWNTTGNPTAIKLDVTNTASGNNSYLLDLQVGGIPQFTVFKGGEIKTSSPAGGVAQTWKLGSVQAVTPTSPNRTIEVEVNGTTYYIHAKTTND